MCECVCVILPGRLLHGRTLDIIFSSSSFPCQLARLFYHHREGGMRGLVACLPGGWLHDIYTRTLFGPKRFFFAAETTQQASEHSSSYKSTERTSKENNCLCTSTSFLAQHNMCARLRSLFAHTILLLLLSRTPKSAAPLNHLYIFIRRLCSLLPSFQQHRVSELEFECQIKESNHLGNEFLCENEQTFVFCVICATAQYFLII